MPYGCVRMTVFLRRQSDAEGLPLHHLCKAELDQGDHLYASSHAVPVCKCILQPWLCQRGKVLLPHQLTLAVLSIGECPVPN